MMPYPDSFPVPLIRLNETTSTNSYLQSLCTTHREIEELTTVVADFQTTGRGQRGNSWESENGANLLFSFVLFPDFMEARCQFLISQFISLAIKEELEMYTTGITIKWPNDIYWKDKKIVGMLIENELIGTNICQSIAGIGLNINQENFHSLAPNPVSLFQITGKKYNPTDILSNLMIRIKEYYKQLRQGETEWIASRYKASLYRKEGMHLYRDIKGKFMAEIIRIEPDGKLVVRNHENKETAYLFKEIEFLIYP